MAIQVGSVEVDVIPNTRGIYGRLQAGLLPAANRIGEQMGRSIGQHITVNVTNAIRDGIQRGGRQATTVAGRQGGDAGGAFGRTFRTRVEGALRSLPDIRIGADTSEADADIRALRVQLETLASQRVGVDVDAATARRQIEELERELQRLGASSPDVAVRINTAAAVGELALLRAEIDRLDGRDVDVRVDPAVSSFGMLTTAAAAFGPVLLPVLPVVAAGLGAIAAAGTAAAVGIGAMGLVAIPAFKDIGGALQAQKAAQDAATSSTNSGAAAAVQAQQRAIQMASATQALAAAQRSAAQQIAGARDQVARAERSVVDAEERLADAQKDSRQAQLDLIEARKDAARQLEDLAARYESAQLSQRDAALSLAEAQERQREVEKDKKSTALDRERAALAVDQATQRLKEQTTETARLKKETAEANRAGVNGSETVKAAQDRLADAQDNVRDRTRGVADAQLAVVKAQQNVARVQQQAADSIASAQRQIQSAQMQTATSASTAATAQQKYQQALAKMTPAARGTFDAFVRLRGAFSAWSRSLQPHVMPIFTRALDGIRKSLPGLTPFVLEAAKAIGNLQDRVSRGFKSPWWQSFKQDLAGSVRPAIEGLGGAFGNIFKGMAGVIQAFLPHMDGISNRMQTITQRFATWGANLKGSPQFERFLAYSAEHGPMLSDLLGNLVRAFFDLGVALSPLAGTATSFINALATGISAIPTPLLTTLGVAFASIAIGAKLAALAMAIWRGAQMAAAAVTAVLTGQTVAMNAAMRANVIGIIITAIMALVLALIYAYQNSETFRAIVQGAWESIKTIISWVWENVLKPIFNALAVAFTAIGDAATWLWETVLRPTFQWIGDKAKWLWEQAIKPAWDNIKLAMQIIGDAISILWEEYAKPILTWLGDKGKWLWDKALKPAFDNIKKGVEAIGQSFEDAKDFIGKAWNKIQDLAKKPVKFIIETIYNKGIVPTWNKIATAFGANPLKEIVLPKGFASGGILPGYTPGKDVHKFVSPTGGGLELSGGEAIMRPEFTRAVGSGFVNTMNRIATTRGATGVKAALAPALGGNDTTQRFADGGIFSWIGNKVAGVGSAAWDKVKEGASWLTDSLEKSARAGMKYVIDPLLAKFPGAATNFGQMIRKIPTRILDSIFGYSKEADKKGAGGIGGPRIQAALKWAKTQHGLPYQWAGNGNPSWDCSGFMSAIESVIRGQKPHRRWATGAFSGKTAPSGWVLNGKSPFQIGVTNAGVGHTAGTLGRTNVESRGGDGVVVGTRARGANSMMFPDIYGFMPGKFDSGGYLQPGLNLAYNGTGRPEPVFTTQQANALTRMATAGAGDLGDLNVQVFVGDREITDIARAEVTRSNGELVSVLRAGRKG